MIPLHHVLIVCGDSSRRLVFPGDLGPVADDKDVQEATDQKCDPGEVVEERDLGFLSQTQAQKRHKDEVESLPAEAVHEPKIEAHAVVDLGRRGPPHEFVEEEEDGKEDHVKGQKGFAQDLDPVLMDPDDGKDAQERHQDRQSHVQDAEHAQDAPALSFERSMSVRPIGSCDRDTLIDISVRYRRRCGVVLRIDPTGFTVSCHSLLFCGVLCCAVLLY